MTTVINYGGGTNSAGLAAGWVAKDLPPPGVVVFADTGGERPETYEHVAMMSAWLQARGGWPAIVTVKATFQGQPYSLEAHCHRTATMPSIAYGFKSCSQKFKAEPVEKFLNNLPAAQATWSAGEQVVRCMGFDADEAHRAARGRDTKKFRFTYPLISWGWGRDECVAAIARADLPQPGKSSCFFCPNSKPAEIRALPDDLKRRALVIEDASHPEGSIKGLGRHFSWRRLIEFGESQGELFTPAMPCECVDGAA